MQEYRLYEGKIMSRVVEMQDACQTIFRDTKQSNLMLTENSKKRGEVITYLIKMD